MRVWECKVCGHIEFDHAPEKCPICRSTQEAFAENPGALQKPGNPVQPTEGEKKHVPKIDVSRSCDLVSSGECLKVQVKIGDILHVMQTQHYIRYCDFYLDHRFISRVWFSPEVCYPATVLHVTAQSGTVTVIENCNIHGNWWNEVSV